MKGLLAIALAGTLLGSASAAAQMQSDPSAVAGASSLVPKKPTANSTVAQNTPVDAQTRSMAASNAATPQAAPQQEGTPLWLIDQKSGCAALAIKNVTADAAEWTGRCAAGLVNGPGTLSITLKGLLVESLTGDFDRGAIRDGHAEIKWADGSSYAGDAVAGQMEGAGALTTAAGDRFEGRWVAGRLNGHGSARWSNGDRYEGDWRDGKANGNGVQVWADGRQYDGEWQNDLPNGHGLVTRKDGTRYQAQFADGRPKDAPLSLAAAAPSAGIVPVAAIVPSDAALNTAVARDADTNKDDAESGSAPPETPISGLSGKKLVAVDGSSLTLITTDDGIKREIDAPNGSAKIDVFAFLNDRVGSVADENDEVVGVFRLTEKGFVVDYSDGRSELLFPNGAGGVSISLREGGGDAVCTAWYPEGHRFSIEERKIALAAYASHLGLSDDHKKPAKHASPPKPSCTAGAITNAAVVTDLHPASRRAVEAKSSPQPAKETTAAHVQLQDAPNLPSPAPHVQLVEVRASTVHSIDDPTAPPIPMDANSSALPVPKPVSASACLSVESDGQHWNFRNHCGYDVQFAYCLMNASDPLASCNQGAISGSVAPNGSSALIADKSLAETDVDHDFRWVACGGGAGEVVVHLDRMDPPTGRCVRPGAT